MSRYSCIAALALCTLVVGCSKDTETTITTPTIATPPIVAAPAIVNANSLIAVTIGSPVTYDATRGGTVFSDPVGRGLTYTVGLSGAVARRATHQA